MAIPTPAARLRLLHAAAMAIGLSLAPITAGAATGMNRPPQAPIDILATADIHDFTDQWTGSQIYPSEHGIPGWPGFGVDWSHPDLTPEKRAKTVIKWGFPCRIPYPGSVEHVMVYTQRYIPVVPRYNARTLLKNFRGTELPGVAKNRVTSYAEPVYYVPKYTQGSYDSFNTGLTRKPVEVVSWDATHPPFELNLGTLDPGTYAVRVIAATETANVERMPKRLVLRFSVNDGLKGEVNESLKRCAAVDEFYSITEFFFHAPETRAYTCKLWVDPSSRLPLLVYNLDLHDRLALLARQAGKKTATLYDEKARATEWQAKGGLKPDPRTLEQQTADAEAIWTNAIPLNAQPWGMNYNYQWEQYCGSVYATPEIIAKDDGAGVDFYDELPALAKELKLTRRTCYPRAYAYGQTMKGQLGQVGAGAGAYHANGDQAAAFDGAVALARWALTSASIGAHQSMQCIDVIPAFGGLAGYGDSAFRRRMKEMFYGMEGAVLAQAEAYDRLFPFIRDSETLPKVLNRFIPWIKTSADVRRFYDTYLLQFGADQIIAYTHFLDSPTAQWMSRLMAIQQDPQVTRPWGEWLFRHVWVYPNVPMGVDEIAVNAVGRDGGDRKGSTYYSLGGSFLPELMNDLRTYTANGGRLPLDMTDPVKFPKAEWSRRFLEQVGVAGGYIFLVGDVGGPNRPRLHEYRDNPAAKAPTNPSRVLADWFGVMESGLESEDFRFRRAAGVRVGYGVGHHHDDPLDLQIWAHGVPMCGDGGGRTGYATPANAAVQSHNTVVSPLAMETSHRWVSSFAPALGAQYLEAQVKCGGFYGRQLALIDADAGRPAETTNAWPVTPNSYVLDVFRVRGGGKAPSYAFHGPPPDEFTVNAPDKRKADFGGFIDPESKWEGTAPDTLTAQWRMRRDPAEIVYRDNGGTEKKFGVPGAERMAMNEARLGAALTDAVPRKHIRMRLLGHKGARAWGARAFCPNGEPFMNENLYVTPAAWGGETVFPVVFEPFAGPSDGGFIAGIKLLTPASSLTNAAAPVAVEVTLKNGRRDVIVMAPRGSGPATIPGVGTVDGEYAFLSWDGKGLRQAVLAGGTVIETSELKLKAERAAYEGTVKAADYYAKTAVFDAPLPASAAGSVLEIGPPSRHTSYTIEKANGATVQFDKGMDFAMGRVREFLPEGAPVLQSPIERVEGLTGSDDSFRNWWRVGPPVQPEGQGTSLSAAAGGGAHPAEMKPWELAINLVGDKPAKDVLKPGSVVRLWEFGPGDAWRLPATVRVDRKADGSYEGKANVAATVEVRGKKLDVRP